MGHYYTEVEGIGRNRAEAERAAVEDFLCEEGNRHSVRGVSKPLLIDKVPPEKEVRTLRGNSLYITREPDITAPKEQWLERWRFELHTHA